MGDIIFGVVLGVLGVIFGTTFLGPLFTSKYGPLYGCFFGGCIAFVVALVYIWACNKIAKSKKGGKL